MRSSSRSDAEPPAPIEGVGLRPMEASDLDQVLAIEQAAFATPWRREHFLYEIRENRYAVNRVARRGDEVIAYSCVWCLHAELKINNFAVGEAYRKRGVGSWMLRRLLADALGRGCRTAQLEVRPSSAPALALYARFGFAEIGRRKGYYGAEGEDAIVMERTLAPEESGGV